MLEFVRRIEKAPSEVGRGYGEGQGKKQITALYLAHREKAIRIAWSICQHDAEDVVQDVALYLLEKKDYLTKVPGPAYFYTAVSRTAKRRHLYAWTKYVVAMDPETLVLAEQAMYERDHGGRA